jgi:hypothetical protein
MDTSSRNCVESALHFPALHFRQYTCSAHSTAGCTRRLCMRTNMRDLWVERIALYASVEALARFQGTTVLCGVYLPYSLGHPFSSTDS